MASTRRPLPFLITGRCWRARATTRCGNRSSRVSRQCEGHRGTNVISQAHDAAVGLGDGLHDGQAQAGAAAGARLSGRSGRTDARDSSPGTRSHDHERCSSTTSPSRLPTELHVTGTVGERVVQQVAEGIFEPLTIRRDGGLIGHHGDRAALKLRSTAGPVGHLLE